MLRRFGAKVDGANVGEPKIHLLQPAEQVSSVTVTVAEK
jgi:hypothetical protein